MNINHYFQFCSRIVVCGCGLSLATLLPLTVQAQTLSWTRQVGTSYSDSSGGVVTDSNSNVYISGYTRGSLGGANQGSIDAWIAKYNSTGALIWKKQLGTSSSDGSSSVATDSIGNIYISGYTQGSLGGANQGSADAWIAKYNTNGALIWKKQLGTSSSDNSSDVTTDSIGNIYISGVTYGSLEGANQGSADVWVAKYNSSGVLVWKRQLGTFSYEYSSGIATDTNSNIYISGSTEGSLGGANQGSADAWIAKYNTNGALLWKKQLGTSSSDNSSDVATDSKGNIYISGDTDGSLGGTNQGSNDVWVAKYNTNGALVWKKQLGTSSVEYSSGVATDSNSNVYISGDTGGSLGGTFQGGFDDAWVAKYSQLN